MKIRDLTDFFTTKQNSFKQYLNSFNRNLPKSASKTKNLKLINTPNSFTPATEVDLLKFIICEKLANLDYKSDSNLIIQFTRRTRLKQQKGQTKFDQLPEITQKKYENFGRKILQWITSEFTSPELNKIIIDRLPEHKTKHKQVNLRITFYKQNHPEDLNLKVTPQIKSLKQVSLPQLLNRLKKINGIELKTDYSSKDAEKVLPALKTDLNQIDKKQPVHKLFKCLIGFKPYYLLIAEPETIIADFTKHKLPTELKTDYSGDKFTLHFDNDYHLVVEINQQDPAPELEIDFQRLPNQLDLLSF